MIIIIITMMIIIVIIINIIIIEMFAEEKVDCVENNPAQKA